MKLSSFGKSRTSFVSFSRCRLLCETETAALELSRSVTLLVSFSLTKPEIHTHERKNETPEKLDHFLCFLTWTETDFLTQDWNCNSCKYVCWNSLLSLPKTNKTPTFECIMKLHSSRPCHFISKGEEPELTLYHQPIKLCWNSLPFIWGEISSLKAILKLLHLKLNLWLLKLC